MKFWHVLRRWQGMVVHLANGDGNRVTFIGCLPSWQRALWESCSCTVTVRTPSMNFNYDVRILLLFKLFLSGWDKTEWTMSCHFLICQCYQFVVETIIVLVSTIIKHGRRLVHERITFKQIMVSLRSCTRKGLWRHCSLAVVIRSARIRYYRWSRG